VAREVEHVRDSRWYGCLLDCAFKGVYKMRRKNSSRVDGSFTAMESLVFR